MTIDQYNDCVEKFADRIYRFILKNLKDDDRSQDVVQDTFLKLWNKVDTVNYTKAKSYLFTTAYHTMIDLIRKEKRITDMEDVDFSSHYSNDQYSDLKEVLDKQIDKLPPQQKAVLLLRDYEGYSYKDIEEVTGLNESQVKVYIYRARIFLKKQLKSIDILV
jgi:RNA polymerase sigma factor (sigma-70 family)